MKSLQLVLLFKIVLTFGIWSIPLLVLPSSWLLAIGFPNPEAVIVFIRLLGAAYFALGIGYILGFCDSVKNRDIGNVVTVGIISNGLACAILLIFSILGHWSDWGFWAKAFMWGSIIATGLITLGLLVSPPIVRESSKSLG